MFESFILIGGKSSRMQTDKARLRLGGETFVERLRLALEALNGREISLLSGNRPAADLVDFELPLIADIFVDCGALGGLHAGLANAKSEWAMFAACDFPFASVALFKRLAAIAESSRNEIAAVVPVQPDGRTQPLLAAYRVAPCLKIAHELLQNQRAPAARCLAENVTTRTVGFAELADLPDHENFFFNVNTAFDYSRAQAICRQTSGQE